MNTTPTTTAMTVQKSNARLMGHARRVTLQELRDIAAPERTKTWNPIPHIEVVEAIREQVVSRNWKFANERNPFEVSVTEKKLFGVASIIAPMMNNDDYRLAIGFRQSYNKTMALKVAVGEHVMVCDNMMMHGDIVFRREHTSQFDMKAEAERAFAHIEDGIAQMLESNAKTRKITISRSTAMSFLMDAVIQGALPQTRIIEAANHYDAVLAGKADDILDPDTVWGVKQAVTHELRGMSPNALYARSHALTQVVIKYAS